MLGKRVFWTAALAAIVPMALCGKINLKVRLPTGNQATVTIKDFDSEHTVGELRKALVTQGKVSEDVAKSIALCTPHSSSSRPKEMRNEEKVGTYYSSSQGTAGVKDFELPQLFAVARDWPAVQNDPRRDVVTICHTTTYGQLINRISRLPDEQKKDYVAVDHKNRPLDMSETTKEKQHGVSPSEPVQIINYFLKTNRIFSANAISKKYLAGAFFSTKAPQLVSDIREALEQYVDRILPSSVAICSSDGSRELQETEKFPTEQTDKNFVDIPGNYIKVNGQNVVFCGKATRDNLVEHLKKHYNVEKKLEIYNDSDYKDALLDDNLPYTVWVKGLGELKNGVKPKVGSDTTTVKPPEPKGAPGGGSTPPQNVVSSTSASNAQTQTTSLPLVTESPKTTETGKRETKEEGGMLKKYRVLILIVAIVCVVLVAVGLALGLRKPGGSNGTVSGKDAESGRHHTKYSSRE